MALVDAIGCAMKSKYLPHVSGRIISSLSKSHTLVFVCRRRYVIEGGLRICRNKHVSEKVQKQQHVGCASNRIAIQQQHNVMHQ